MMKGARSVKKSSKVIITAATFALVLRRAPMTVKQSSGEMFSNREIHKVFNRMYSQKPVKEETHVKLDIPDNLPFEIKVPKKKKIEIVVPEWAAMIGNGSKMTKDFVSHIQGHDQGDPGDPDCLKNDIIRQSKPRIEKTYEEENADLARVLKEYKK